MKNTPQILLIIIGSIQLLFILIKNFGNRKRRKQLKQDLTGFMELLNKGLDALGITDKVFLSFNILFALGMIVLYGFGVTIMAYTKYHNWYIAAIPLLIMIALGYNFIHKSIDLYIALSKKK